MNRREQGLRFIYKYRQDFLEELLDMTAVEAPSFHEERRAEILCKRFAQAGLDNVHIDKAGNAIGFRWGRDRESYILIEAHMDTVFPFGTVTTRPGIDEDGIIRCPGVSDNTAGLINLIYTAEALRYAEIHLEKTLIFAGTVNEESEGNHGIKSLLETYNDGIKACLTIDGCEYEDIVYKATAIKTKKFVIYGMGGHPYSEYGVVPQVLKTAAEIVSSISDIAVPKEPKTVVVVTSLCAGDENMPHAIPNKASFVVNYRSNSKVWMKLLDEKIDAIVQCAVNREKEKWNFSEKEITLGYAEELLCDVPGGEQSDDYWIVRALDRVIRELGGEPYYAKGGCCNSNIPIALGIPSVAIGTSNLERGEHTIKEFTPTDHIYKCTQEVFLMALELGGMKN